MLAALVFGAVVAVLVATVVTGERQTRFDEEFEQALPLAETGLDRMAHLVESGEATEDFTVPHTTVDAGHYEGRAERVSPNSWDLTATGTSTGGTSRTVSLQIRRESLFGVAAYGRTQVALRGNNTADSYRSGSFDDAGGFTTRSGGSDICREDGTPADPFNTAHASGTRMCDPTGNGVVSTNEELFLLGDVIADVDRAEIHYARENVDDPLPGATGFCSGVTATCSSDKLHYFRGPIELEPDPVTLPSDQPNRGSFPQPDEANEFSPGVHVRTNVRLDGGTDVQGTPEDPTIIYLTGTLTVPNQEVVNFRTNAAGEPVPEPPSSLLVFSAGSGPALRFGNHASFSGAIYAPRATFSGGAAGNIYGSMVAGSVETRGSWNFHYDDALGEVSTEATSDSRNWTER